MLRAAMIIMTTREVMIMGFDGSEFVIASFVLRTNGRGRILNQKPSSKQASAGTMVSQLRKERLPLAMRIICNNKITDPAIWRAIRGQNMNQGAMSSARKLYHTPALNSIRGRKWNHLLNGPGNGWVSK